MSNSIKKGEVWLVNLGEANGSIQGGERPCIVISNDKANMHSPVIHIVPMTTRTKNKLPTHVDIGVDCGIIKNSIALVEQTTSINKDALSKRIGKVDDVILGKLEVALFIQFDMMGKIKHMLKNRTMATV